MNKQKLRFIPIVLVILSLNLVPNIAKVKGNTQIVEIETINDAKIMESHPDTNYGAEQYIRLWYNPKEEGFLFFNLDSIMEKNYTNVMLRMRASELSLGATLQIFPINESWNEDTITWNNAPDVNMNIMCSYYFATIKLGFYHFNVTSIVSNWTSGIIPNFGFYLKVPLNGMSFHSKEHSDEETHPTLEIEIKTPSQESSPGIAGYEVSILLLGMIGVISLLLTSRIRKNVS